jgi:glycosyltransferase involved in cell wall biosynthesis
MSKSRLVSAVVPVFNGERYIGAALDSIFSQTYQMIEVFVVDDGSTDNTLSVLKSYHGKIQLIRQENSGPAAARNRGVEACNGEYIAFLDADDLWEREKVESQVREMLENPELEAVLGMVREFSLSDSSAHSKANEPVRTGSLPGFLPSTLLIRRESFQRIGPFDSSYPVGEFIEWFSRAKTAGLRWKMLESVVLNRRVHESNLGILKRPDYRQNYLKLLKEHLSRIREKNGKQSGD